MTTARQAQETLDELVAELAHADTLIAEQAEQAERIEALEAEIAHLRAALVEARGAAA